MRVCLIGNYPPDRQESMARFGQWLEAAIRESGGTVEVVLPQPRVLHFLPWPRMLRKWMGYLDKFVLFPRYLKQLARKPENASTVFHIVDHSNAVYARFLPRSRTLVTCHDVLAIRGGIGDNEAWCPPSSRLGTTLQRWILKHLQDAPRLVFVSEATRRDYDCLPRMGSPRLHLAQSAGVIPNGLNAVFFPMPVSQADSILSAKGISPGSRFFFHIGSSLPRKNRASLMIAFASIASELEDVFLVLAGDTLSGEEERVRDQMGAASLRIHQLPGVSHELLIACYSRAMALVFPSFSEGFGWPVIEAQSCDCPVICSNRTSLPEVAGEGAILVDPSDVNALSEAMIRVTNGSVREELIRKGRLNLPRFGKKRTTAAYLELYRQITPFSP